LSDEKPVREIRIYPRHTRVRWLGANPEGWAGPGIGKLVDFEKARPYFPLGTPGTKDEPPKGPAYEIKLEHNRLRQWVGITEVELAPEEPPVLPEEPTP